MAEFVELHVRSRDLVRAVFSGEQRNTTSSWRRVEVRRVDLRGTEHLQFNWHTDRKSLTRNYALGQDTPPIAELAAVPFRTAHVETLQTTVEARVTKRGKLIVATRAADNRPAETEHDKRPQRLIPEDAPFLETIGMSSGGAVKPTAQRKYRQINEFARIVDRTLCTVEPGSPIDVVDLGCGNAYLTFVVHHLLTAVRKMDCRITGVDRDRDTVARNNERAYRLGVHEQLRFENATIDEFTPDDRPDLILALHACDTATDDALALGVRCNAHAMLVSPCCHNHLQRQLRAERVPAGLSPVMRHGVLRQQLGDVLTDAIRASLLGVAGYAVQVFAFVPLEHTARNTLIRAVRQPGPANHSALADYRAITSMVSVRPKLADLLAPS